MYVNLQTLKRKKVNVFKPALTTKVITEIITPANSTHEVAAGTDGPP